MMKSFLSLSLAALVGLTAVAASATDFEISTSPLSTASYTSDADLETISGTSVQVSGTIATDLKDPSKTSGSFSIPVTSLLSGVPMRDEHMAGKDWLNAAEFPNITFAIKSLALKGDSVREPEFQFTPANMPATFLESISESMSGWRVGRYQVRWERVTKPADERLVAWQFHNLKFTLNTVERSVAENLNFPMTLWSIQFEFDAVRTQTVAQRNLGLWSAWADRRPVRHLFELYAVLGQSEVDTFHYVRLLPAGEFASFPSREASAAEVSEDLPLFPDGLFRLVNGSSDCVVFRHRK